jgi:exopolysaccharide biosynthesis protein
MIGTAGQNDLARHRGRRQPELSVGMTLTELRTLAHRLGLVNALNLDGGSTTMGAQGQVMQNKVGPDGTAQGQRMRCWFMGIP